MPPSLPHDPMQGTLDVCLSQESFAFISHVVGRLGWMSCLPGSCQSLLQDSLWLLSPIAPVSVDIKSSILPWGVKEAYIRDYCLECPHCRSAQGPRSLERLLLASHFDEENMLHPLVLASALTGAVYLQRVMEGLEEQGSRLHGCFCFVASHLPHRPASSLWDTSDEG